MINLFGQFAFGDAGSDPPCHRRRRRVRDVRLFITHDLATTKYLCDRLAVMYLGKIVEVGSLREVFTNPQHPYTRALLSAVPVPDPRHRRTEPLPKGEIPNPINPPAGCHYHPRCPIAQQGICDVEVPALLPFQGDASHLVSAISEPAPTRSSIQIGKSLRRTGGGVE